MSAPGRHRRQRRRQIARRRLTVLVVVVLAAAIAIYAATSGGSTPTRAHRSASPTTTAPASAATGPAAAEAGVVPWSLTTAISRPVVLPGAGGTVTVAGGLTASGASGSAVATLDPTAGTVTAAGTLAAPVHDAAAAQLAGQDYVFGGGSPATVATVQRFTPGSPATVVGQLPQPRSDAVGVNIGTTAYVVGGYDGTNPDPAVLATVDGSRFTTVATLPVAVRYPAATVLDGKIYVFGGQATGGPANGQAVDDIQVVDPARHQATVVGHLPQPLAGALAVNLGGTIYLAGGTGRTAADGSTGPATGAVWAFDPSRDRLLAAGTLPVPTAYAGATVVGPRAWIVGGESAGTPTAAVQMLVPNRGFGTAGTPGAGSPYAGMKLLIADRGNNRLLLVDDTGQITWTFPSSSASAPPTGFYFPDDAFFARKGTVIISNQEDNQTIVQLAFPSGKPLWSFGHPGVKGGQPGYLNTPDDAYLLKDGTVVVADAYNCRILFIKPDGTIAGQIGTTGVCAHTPPTAVDQPNGATPLANGDILVSEIQGQWIDEYTPQAKLVWSVHLPIHYPSDPQQIGPDLYLVADYAQTGAFIEFNREGQILYRYQPTSGNGRLNQPSLVELLPSGVLMANDDYRDRLVAVDPATSALVWQYGVTDQKGTAPGMLNTPDGFDLLRPDGTTPTHPATG